MIRLALIGGIGSGKTFISKLFGYPVFNADKVVNKIYLKNKNIYLKLKKKLPDYFIQFPIKKKELIEAILGNKNNIQKISSIVHPTVKKELNIFLKKNRKKKIIILDIPLYLEKKLNKKKDIIVFVESKNNALLKKVKKRKNYNKIIFNRLKKLQLPLSHKKQKSHFIIRNDYNKHSTRKKVQDIIKKLL